MYLAREDSFLLLEQVKKYAKGKVLDLGTGSGIQALGAAERKEVESVLAVDVDKKAVAGLKKTIHHPKITINPSDLFSNVHQKFDTIIFNSPYLPRTKEDKCIEDPALFGGKEGWEIIERFFSQVSKHLNEDGIILMVFSSFTGKEKVNQIISEHGFSFKELSHQHIFFEDLFVYKIKRKNYKKL